MKKRTVSKICLFLSLFVFLTAAAGIAATVAQAYSALKEGGGIIGGAGAPTVALLIRNALLGPWGFALLAALGLLALSLIFSPDEKGNADPVNGQPDTPAQAESTDAPDGEARRYPLSLFLVGTFINLITRNLILTFAALVLSVTGIWVPACRPIGAGLAILSLVLSVIQQLIIRWHILHDPPSEEFEEMRDAMLSKDWAKRTKEVMDRRIGAGRTHDEPDEGDNPDEEDDPDEAAGSVPSDGGEASDDSDRPDGGDSHDSNKE